MPRTAQRGSACSLGFNPTALASTPRGRRLEGQAEATRPHLRQLRAPEGRGRAKSWHPPVPPPVPLTPWGVPRDRQEKEGHRSEEEGERDPPPGLLVGSCFWDPGSA